LLVSEKCVDGKGFYFSAFVGCSPLKNKECLNRDSGSKRRFQPRQLTLANSVFPFPLCLDEQISTFIPSEYIKTSSTPFPALIGLVEEVSSLRRKITRVRREGPPEFSAPVVNPNASPAISSNQSKYCQLCKKRLALEIDHGFTPVGTLNRRSLPRFEKAKTCAKGNRPTGR